MLVLGAKNWYMMGFPPFLSNSNQTWNSTELELVSGLKIILDYKFFGFQIFWGPNFSVSGLKIILDHKFFWVPNFLGSKCFRDPNFSVTENVSVPKFFRAKIFRGSNYRNQIYFRTKNFFCA